MLFGDDSLYSGILQTFIATFGAAITAGLTALFVWFRSELDECKRDRKQLTEEVELLQQSVAELEKKVIILEFHLKGDENSSTS